MDIALSAAREAGKIVLKYFGRLEKIEYKGEFDVVTEADRESQEKIIEIIHSSFPKHNILAEESSPIDKNSDYTWIIDPLDGTTNFSHRYPFFCISVALRKRHEIMLGIVYNPLSKELFHAQKGEGAFLNNKKITVSETKSLKYSMIATGFPYNKHSNPENNLMAFERIAVCVQGLRRDGAAALDMCYVACGRLDAYWELCVRPWDVAAGILIVKEAGGQVTDFNGDKLKLDYTKIVATNSHIHEGLLKIIGGKNAGNNTCSR
ncbi:inositol monophosphatase [Candidatus Woesearchaeota archaeon]|nr:inositol monophosphatase [Candidatus Woesearchaeota archaeon]